MASSRISCRSRRWSSSSRRLCRPPRRSSRPSIRPAMPSIRPAMPSSRPSSCANGLASLSGSDSTARMIAATAASCASSLATVSSSRSASTLTSVRSGSSDSRLRMVPSASRAARRAWISSSESKICCCSLSRISAARLSMSAHAVERHGRVCTHRERSFLFCGTGSGSRDGEREKNVATRRGSPTRRVPVRSSTPDRSSLDPPISTWSGFGRPLFYRDGCVRIRAQCPLTVESIRDAPKVLLHDHLDGGLRPGTVVELADAAGYAALPSRDPAELAAWFLGAAHSGSLERYLETFGHTVAVMQTTEALVRVAAECAEDLAADGVVYAEVRFAPELHVEQRPEPRGRGRGRARGLPVGHRRGRGERPADPGRLPAHRDAPRRAVAARSPSWPCATATSAWSASTSPAPRRASRPPATSTPSSTSASRTRTSRSTPARRSGCRRSGRPSSGAAPTGSATACGSSTTSRSTSTASPASDASRPTCATRRIPLEMCPTSNVHTGAASSIADHPIGLLARLRFRVTVNTDNRLMSGCSMTQRAARPRADVRVRLGRPALVHDQRDEVGLLPLRRPAHGHRRRDQARLRRVDGVRAGPREWGSSASGREEVTTGRGDVWLVPGTPDAR